MQIAVNVAVVVKSKEEDQSIKEEEEEINLFWTIKEERGKNVQKQYN